MEEEKKMMGWDHHMGMGGMEGCGKMGMMEGMGKMMDGEMMKMIMYKWLPKIAKMDLLKEKMKKKIEAAEGKKLDEIADLLVTSMMEKNRMKREGMMKKEQMMEKLQEIMSED